MPAASPKPLPVLLGEKFFGGSDAGFRYDALDQAGKDFARADLYEVEHALTGYTFNGFDPADRGIALLAQQPLDLGRRGYGPGGDVGDNRDARLGYRSSVDRLRELLGHGPHPTRVKSGAYLKRHDAACPSGFREIGSSLKSRSRAADHKLAGRVQ